MSRIRSKDTSPELKVRRILIDSGYRYRLHVKTLSGRPDIAIGRFKTAIFINGCFWHQHEGCKRKSQPKSNIGYWGPKLKRNIDLQKKSIQDIKHHGWNVLVIWECQTVQKDDILNVVRVISKHEKPQIQKQNI